MPRWPAASRSLRQRVLMLRPGDASIEERRARLQRMIDRVSLEIELARGGETAAPSAAAPQRDRRFIEPLIARCAVSWRGSRAAPAVTPARSPPTRRQWRCRRWPARV